MKSQMEGNDLVHSLRSNKYFVRMSKDAYDLLKRCFEVRFKAHFYVYFHWFSDIFSLTSPCLHLIWFCHPVVATL